MLNKLGIFVMLAEADFLHCFQYWRKDNKIFFLGFKSPELLKVALPVLPIINCQRVYSRFAPITTKQICAGGFQGRDSCGGDSGGPLTTVNKFNGIPKYIQYGIVSYGPRHCGTEGKPGIYTRVSKYMLWILDNIKPWDD